MVGHRVPLVVVGVLLLANLILAMAVRQYLVPTVNEREQQLIRRQSELRGGRGNSPVQQFIQGEKDLVTFREKIPPHREFTGLIVELQELADDAGLDLTQVSYRHQEDDGQNLLSYQIGFSVTGQYPDVKQFIHALEQSRRLVIIQQINLQGAEEEDIAGVRLQLSLQTFFQAGAS